jgi:hypothetical protein
MVLNQLQQVLTSFRWVNQGIILLSCEFLNTDNM